MAIPHARVDNLSQPLIAIGIGRKGVQYLDSGRKARIIVLLLSPVEPPEKHLETLGIISRMAADDLLRKSLLAANESRAVREMVKDWAIKNWLTDVVKQQRRESGKGTTRKRSYSP